MTSGRPNWEALNAYVDGELPPDEAAAVARALVEDRALAEQVAALAKLKAATHAGSANIAAPAFALPRRRRGTLVAAMAALAAMILVTVIAYQEVRPVAGSNWIAEAWQAHRNWVARDRAGSHATVDAGIVLARLNQLGVGAEAPDLSSAQLSIDYVGSFDLPGQAAGGLQIGYVGTRGCHLSLIVFPSPPELGAEETELKDGAGRGYAWRVGPLAYALLAVGMDDVHLALIARTFRHATMERQPLDAQAETALRQSRMVSRPCAA